MAHQTTQHNIRESTRMELTRTTTIAQDINAKQHNTHIQPTQPTQHNTTTQHERNHEQTQPQQQTNYTLGGRRP